MGSRGHVPWRGSGEPEPFSASGGIKNGGGSFRYRARKARDNTEMRIGAPSVPQRPPSPYRPRSFQIARSGASLEFPQGLQLLR